jgi:hypothetical protein
VLTHANRQNSVAQVTALSELRDLFGTQERSWDEIEPSFEILDQETFADIPLVIGAFRFNESKKFMSVNPETGMNEPGVFVSMLLASYDPDSESLTSPWVIVNDGSTGIKAQLERYAAQYDGDTRLAPPLKVSKGFRRSDYTKEITDDKGKVKLSEATTWYLG